MWGRAITITRLAGIDIKLDASWLVIAGLIVWGLTVGYLPRNLPQAAGSVRVIAAVLICLGVIGSLIVHEMAHAAVARRHGLGVSGVTLLIFGGMAEMNAAPPGATAEIRIAAAGPLASIGLAALFWIGAQATGIVATGSVSGTVLGCLSVLNLLLAGVNMVPALPLDAGRVLRAMLWKRCGDHLRATRRTATVSVGIAWAMIGIGFWAVIGAGQGAVPWPGLLLITFGVYVLAQRHASGHRFDVQQKPDARTVADLMTRNPVTVHPDLTLSQIVDGVILTHGVSFVPVVEHATVLGYVDLAIIRGIDREHWATTTADDVLETLSDDCSIDPDAPAHLLLQRMAKGERHKFLVVRDHALMGVVALGDVTAYLDGARNIKPER